MNNDSDLRNVKKDLRDLANEKIKIIERNSPI